MTNLKNLPLPDLKAALANLGEPSFRFGQTVKWIYQKRVATFDDMRNVSKATRARLSERFSLAKMPVRATLESQDHDAVKFGFELPDGSGVIESVLLIDDDRRTACISSQLGCGLGCVFCETGRMGFLRNLTLEEIIGQLIGINDYLAGRDDKLVTNIVFMGMGEALSNFENFRSALDIIMAEEGFGIGGRRITVSTAGVIPSIDRLIAEDLNIGLAISLNTYSDAKRDRIMPVNKHYPIKTLVDAARRYFEKTGRRVTFEYVVIEGENDTTEAVDALRTLLGGMACKINVIGLNPSSSTDMRPPSGNAVQRFADALYSHGLTVTVRASRGRDIMGACGQLRASLKSPQQMPDNKQ